MIPLNKTVEAIRRLLLRFRTRKCHTGKAGDEIQRRIQYQFVDESLLVQALTHKSSVNSDDKKGLCSNERLEFLGDAILDCLVTEHIYKRYRTHSEGQLSKIKSLVVSRKILGEIAQAIPIGPFLIVGQSERKAGGNTRFSIVSNAFEAILGAIYLDGGLEAARKFLDRFLFDRIENFINDKGNINFKSKILECAQADGFGIPSYPLISEDGPDHAKTFVVGVDIAGLRLGEGSGLNKKEAQQNAAYNALCVYSKEFIETRLKGVRENELFSH